MKTTAIAGLLCGLVALSGCVPAGPSVTPAPASPSPTYLCTPESGGTPAPCTESEFQAMQAKDALYAEAEQVYRAYFAENERVYRAGTEASELLLSFVSGDATEQVRHAHSGGAGLEGGDFSIAWVRRLPGVSKGGSTVALEACTDASTATRRIGSESLGPGRIAHERIYLGGPSGDLRILWVEHMVVTTC